MSNFNLHAPGDAVTDPQVALTYLKEGNARFVNDTPIPRNTNKADLEVTSGGQKPFAAILTCADSRVCPEIFFDQKIGDIFILRNAGNVAEPASVGSIEFGTKHLGAPLVVVVGHTKCGAVYTAHAGATGLSDALQAVIDGLKPNVKDSADEETGVIDNVKIQVAALKANPVLKEQGTMVLGAVYDLTTGVVNFLD